MKKTLIALAVAGVVSAPAFAATSNVDVYGVMHIAIEDNNVTDSDIQVTDHQSRIGFKGSEDLGGGLSAIWQIEQAISNTPASSDGVGGNTFANRNTFVGLKGAFGTVLMGRHDTPYKLSTAPLDLFSDTAGDWNLGGVGITKNALIAALVDDGMLVADANSIAATFGASGIKAGYINTHHDLRSPSLIQYVSPSFSGLTMAAAAVASNSAASMNSGDSVDSYSLSANYTNGPLFVAAGYQNIELTDSKAWKIGAGYTMGALKLGAVYEDANLGNGLDLDFKTWGLNAAYNMGAITLKAAYMDNDFDGLGNGKQYTVGADYALSKRTVAYALYNADKADRIDTATFNATTGVGTLVENDKRIGTWGVGLKHSF